MQISFKISISPVTRAAINWLKSLFFILMYQYIDVTQINIISGNSWNENS